MERMGGGLSKSIVWLIWMRNGNTSIGSSMQRIQRVGSYF